MATFDIQSRMELLQSAYDAELDLTGLALEVQIQHLANRAALGGQLKELYSKLPGMSTVLVPKYKTAVSAVLNGAAVDGSCFVVDGHMITARHAVKDEQGDVPGLKVFGHPIFCAHDCERLDLAILKFQQEGQQVPGSLPLLPKDAYLQQGDELYLLSFPATVYKDIKACKNTQPVISEGIASCFSINGLTGLADVGVCAPGSSGGLYVKRSGPFAGYVVGLHIDMFYHLEKEDPAAVAATDYPIANIRHKAYAGVFITSKGIRMLLAQANGRRSDRLQAAAKEDRKRARE